MRGVRHAAACTSDRQAWPWLFMSPPEKQPASMRKEAVEAAVKRTSDCCWATDSTLPTAAPRLPAGGGNSSRVAGFAFALCWEGPASHSLVGQCCTLPPPLPPPLTGDHQLGGDALIPPRRLFAARLAPQQGHGGWAGEATAWVLSGVQVRSQAGREQLAQASNSSGRCCRFDRNGALAAGGADRAAHRRRRPLAVGHENRLVRAPRASLRIMQASRRLYKLLPLLAARGGAPAAGADAALLKPIQDVGARALSSRHGGHDADGAPAADAWEHRGRGGGERRRGDRGGRGFQDARPEAPIDAPRTLRDYQRMVAGLARRRKCVALALPAGAGASPLGAAHRLAAMHALRPRC